MKMAPNGDKIDVRIFSCQMRERFWKQDCLDSSSTLLNNVEFFCFLQVPRVGTISEFETKGWLRTNVSGNFGEHNLDGGY